MKTPLTHPESQGNSIHPRDLSRCSTEEGRSLVPLEVAARLKILPLGVVRVRGERTLCVATHRRDGELEQHMRVLTNCAIRAVLLPEETITSAIQFAYRGGEDSLRNAIRNVEAVGASLHEAVSSAQGIREGCSVEASFLTSLLDHAIRLDASDIHLTPKPHGLIVRLRLKTGELTDETRMTSLDVHRRVIQRLKVFSKLDIAVHHLPQDGGFEVPTVHGALRARLSIMPTAWGERAVIRFVGTSAVRGLSQVGYTSHGRSLIERALLSDSGLLVFAGATGSGKTTSLYAAMLHLAERCSLMSVEDPIEVAVPWMTQTEVNTAKGLSFSTVIRSMMRQDPDVIMVGEIRDAETAHSAYKCSLTGHRVLCSIHAGSLADIFARFDSFGIPARDLARAVRLLVHQELTPQLCLACRVLDLTKARIHRERRWRARGCAACNQTGISGRIPIADILFIEGERRDSAEWWEDLENAPSEFYSRKQQARNDFIYHGLIAGEPHGGEDSPP